MVVATLARILRALEPNNIAVTVFYWPEKMLQGLPTFKARRNRLYSLTKRARKNHDHLHNLLRLGHVKP